MDSIKYPLEIYQSGNLCLYDERGRFAGVHAEMKRGQ
jgi:hypothetical protein